MSSSSHGASEQKNPPHNPTIEWALLPHPPEPDFNEPSDLEDTSKGEYDHIYGPAVKTPDTNKPVRAPAQVEDQFTHPTEEPEELGMENVRSQGIAGFMAKVRSYNEAVAEKIQHFLMERGLAESLLGDFQLLLDASDERAQKHREETEKRKEAIKQGKRKQQEWDVIREDDAIEDWELV